MNWRKFPEEKPKEPGQYLVHIEIPGYLMLYEVRRWSENLDHFVGNHSERITHWSTINPPAEHSQYYYDKGRNK